MSKTITFRGRLAMGIQDELQLKTNNGKTGYQIKKFQLISNTPGAGNAEFIGQIFNKDQTGSIGNAVDFSDGNLLAVCFQKSVSNDGLGADSENIIFDNKTFNQNMFISITDATGNTVECNYYIELEAFPITDIEATKLTLQSIRTITSR